MRLVHEFREFALKGNVMDMAVGVIVGGAFGGIVKSLIDDVFMPIVGIAGKADFSNLYVALTPTVHEKIARVAAASAEGSFPSLEEARKLGPVLAYGSFLTVVVNFTILAGIVFLMVKGINAAKKALEKQEQSGPPSPPRPEVQLLTEIRDLLQTPKVSPAATAVAASPTPPTETATAEPEPPRSAIQIRRPSWFRSRA